jgi:hypothetical protein
MDNTAEKSVWWTVPESEGLAADLYEWSAVCDSFAPRFADLPQAEKERWRKIALMPTQERIAAGYRTYEEMNPSTDSRSPR